MKLITLTLLLFISGCTTINESFYQVEIQNYTIDNMRYGKDRHGVCYSIVGGVAASQPSTIPCKDVGL